MMRNNLRTLSIICLFGTCLSFFISCSFKKKKVKKSMTVLSYNIRHGLGMDNVLDLRRIADVINATSPDIVALQEVDINTNRNGKIDGLKELSKMTNMNYVFGKAMDWDGGEYGNGILTKLKIKSHKTYPLPGEPRSALVLNLMLGDKEFTFISTHLDVEKECRMESIPYLDTIMEKYKNNPIIIAGDFNSTPDSDMVKYFQVKFNNATPNIKTYPADSPKKQIDYIMYSPKEKWESISSEVIIDKKASDHRPIKAIFKLN